MIEKRPARRKIPALRTKLNGKSVADAGDDPLKFARELVKRRKPPDLRAEMVESGKKLKAKLAEAQARK